MTNQEELESILLAIASYVIVFIVYKLFKYLFFSVQLMAISRKFGKQKSAWMAWIPGFRTLLIAMLGKRTWWILVWMMLYIPSQLFVIFLFIDNLNDMIETGVKIAHGDILGFLNELIGEDYSEAYLLSLAVTIRTSVPLLLYSRLAQECNRSELWAIPIRIIPIFNLIGVFWLRIGAKDLTIEANTDKPVDHTGRSSAL
jgi:hypothetical protein